MSILQALAAMTYLSQYIFASDRSSINSSIDESLCLHPTFLKVLDEIGSYFIKKSDKEISICGEIAGNPNTLPLILGAGIKVLSTTPELIPETKKSISAMNLKKSRKLLKQAIQKKSVKEVIDLVTQNYQ